MKWTIARARERFSELLGQVHQERQPIFHRGRMVAVMVDPEEYARFKAWQGGESGFSAALQELRQVCMEEDYSFEVGPRGEAWR